MATSHYCHGKWRPGPVGACPRHEKLSKKQPNVYRGVGEPGGRTGSSSDSESGSGSSNGGSSSSDQG